MGLQKVGLVAHDTAPCLAFDLLARELEERGVASRSILLEAGRQPAPADGVQSLADCDLVVIGMSSSPVLAQMEMAAAQWAVENGVPIVFYADTFGAFNRVWFELYRGLARGVFVLDYPGEVVKAHGLFPKALVIPTGNPTHLSYFERPTNREEIRSRLGFSPEDFVILISGGKLKEGNLGLLGAVYTGVQAAKLSQAQVVFGVHPGDKNPLEGYARACDLLTQGGVRFSLVLKKQASSSEIICGADLVIGDSPSIDMEAGCKGVPSIFFIPPGKSEQLMKELGRRDWPPCTDGVSLLAESWMDIHYCLTDHGETFGQLRLRQAEIYQPPQPGTRNRSIEMMAEALRGIDVIVIGR